MLYAELKHNNPSSEAPAQPVVGNEGQDHVYRQSEHITERDKACANIVRWMASLHELPIASLQEAQQTIFKALKEKIADYNQGSRKGRLSKSERTMAPEILTEIKMKLADKNKQFRPVILFLFRDNYDDSLDAVIKDPQNGYRVVARI